MQVGLFQVVTLTSFKRFESLRNFKKSHTSFAPDFDVTNTGIVYVTPEADLRSKGVASLWVEVMADAIDLQRVRIELRISVRPQLEQTSLLQCGELQPFHPHPSELNTQYY